MNISFLSMKHFLLPLLLTHMIGVCCAQFSPFTPKKYSVIPHPDNVVMLKAQVDSIFIPKVVSLQKLINGNNYSIGHIRKSISDNTRALNFVNGVIESFPKGNLTEASSDFCELLLYLDTTLSTVDKVVPGRTPSLTKLISAKDLYTFFSIWSDKAYAYNYLAASLSERSFLPLFSKGTYLYEVDELKKYQFSLLRLTPELAAKYRANASHLVNDNVYFTRVNSDYLIICQSLTQSIVKKNSDMDNWISINTKNFVAFHNTASALLKSKRDSARLKFDSLSSVRIRLKTEKSSLDSISLVITKQETDLNNFKKPLTSTVALISQNRKELRKSALELDKDFEKYFQSYDEYSNIKVSDIIKLLAKQREVLTYNREIFQKRLKYDELRSETDSLEAVKGELSVKVIDYENELTRIKSIYAKRSSQYELNFDQTEKAYNGSWDYYSLTSLVLGELDDMFSLTWWKLQLIVEPK